MNELLVLLVVAPPPNRPPPDAPGFAGVVSVPDMVPDTCDPPPRARVPEGCVLPSDGKLPLVLPPPNKEGCENVDEVPEGVPKRPPAGATLPPNRDGFAVLVAPKALPPELAGVVDELKTLPPESKVLFVGLLLVEAVPKTLGILTLDEAGAPNENRGFPGPDIMRDESYLENCVWKMRVEIPCTIGHVFSVSNRRWYC